MGLLQAALNLDNSVSSMGFYGQQNEKLWCLSHTETVHLWEWAAACDEDSTGIAASPGPQAFALLISCRIVYQHTHSE